MREPTMRARDSRDRGAKPRAGSVVALVLAGALGVAATALAQDAPARAGEPGAEPPIVAAAPAREPFEVPRLAPAVERLLEQDYLTDEERRALRVRHGVWTAKDLEGDDGAPIRARAALTRGAWSDPALRHHGAMPLDRAEAALHRGEMGAAVQALDERAEGPPSLRALRLRAEILEAMGDLDGAKPVLDEAARRLAGEAPADALEVVEGVRALALRARLYGQEAAGGSDFRAMVALLATARTRLDPMCWEAHLAEAQLLREKDNLPEAVEALESVLTLNPSSAEAWALLGEVAVGGFDFERAESVAARLDLMHASAAPADESTHPKEPPALGSSPLGAMIVARARLRQGDATGAAGLLDGVLAAMPGQRQALALRAAAAAGAFEFEDAAKRLAAMDESRPGDPLGHFEVGRVLSGARQYAEAAKHLGEASRRAPFWPDPIIELGLLEMQSGRNDKALEALEVAATLDVFNTRAANSLTLVRELRTFTGFESDHFVVRCKPGVDEVVAREMLGPLEAIHARVTGKERAGIDFSPTGKTVIELMPNHRWFAVRITGLPGIHTIAAATGPVIAMEAPRSGPGHLVGPYDWRRVVQHEYTHTVTLARTNNRLPHWFTEAAAVHMEDSPRDYSTVQLLARAYEAGELFDFEKINIAFVRPEKPTDRQLAYAQGHWMYEHMVARFGERAPLELMDRYAKGEREATAIPAVLKVSREEFFTGFREHARRALVEWGMITPEGVPSVKDLARRDAGGDEEPPAPDEARLEGWLNEHPEHPELLRLLVQARLKAARDAVTPELVPLLERYARARPVDPLPHRLLARHELSQAGEGGAAPGAIPHLEYLDAREQHNPSFSMELSRQYQRAGDARRAMLKAERAVSISPYDATIREFAATTALRGGDESAAERHVRALVAIEPDRPVHQQRLEALLRRRAKG